MRQTGRRSGKDCVTDRQEVNKDCETDRQEVNKDCETADKRSRRTVRQTGRRACTPQLVKSEEGKV